ncbi:MAG: hypothetical protein ACFFD1_04085 [Candidatus Thorarchaeota archaeon]
MYETETILVILGSLFLLIGLYYSYNIIRILKREGLAKPWIVLSVLITFFLIGYFFIILRFSNIEILPQITIEFIIAFVFFFGSIFAVLLTYLNRNLFEDIFGLDLTDDEALQLFLTHFGSIDEKNLENMKKKHQITCDHCHNTIIYSLADIVRSHKNIERGVELQQNMGSLSYILYLRHRCINSRREIQVFHDKNFEYRSQRISRII